MRIAAGQGQDPDEPERDPREVEPVVRRGGADGERTGELQRHRDPQGDAGKRVIEAEVHHRQHEPQQGHERQLLTGQRSDPRSPDEEQDHACGHQAQQDRAPGSGLVKDRRRERRPGLDRGDRADHERGRGHAGQRIGSAARHRG
ncbi:MAG: hypothetical protein ACLP4R_19590 [Solirubrobacteraceae bacterium]